MKKRWFVLAFSVPFVFLLCVNIFHSVKESHNGTGAPLSVPTMVLESTVAGCLGLGILAVYGKLKRRSAP